MTLRIGVKLPHTGALDPTSLADRARELETAGFDSLWVSDHVVLPEKITSFYPFAADGVATWDSDNPYLETVVVLAVAAAATTRVRLGTAVLVAPQRNPVLLAKQIGTADLVSGGRIELGVGAGWLREEFVALEANFERRGQVLEEWVGILRACWTGHPPEIEGVHYRVPAGTLMLPAPHRSVPVHIGGHTTAALRRAGQLGDGWLGQQSVPELSVHDLEREIATVRETARQAGRDPDALRVTLRLVGSAGRHDEVADALAALRTAGVDEIIVDVDPATGDAEAAHSVLRAAAQECAVPQ